MEMKGFMGGLYRLTEWIMRLAYIHVLWLVSSIFIPIIVMVMLLMIDPATIPEGFYFTTIFFLAILAPFTIFPATSAMFSIVRKFVQGTDDAPIFRTFIKGWKENYLKSMIGGIVFVLFYYLVYFNYNFYVAMDGNLRLLSFLFIVLSIIGIISMFHFFNFVVHVEAKFTRLIKNALLMTIGNPIGSLVILVGNAVILYISYFKFQFLLLFFTGSLMAFLTYSMFQRGFDRMVSKAEAMQQNAEADAEGKEGETEETRPQLEEKRE